VFEWDENKRHQTLEKHGLDFLDAVEIFTKLYLRIPAKSDAEHREIAVGTLKEIHIAVVFTHRGETIRIITARKARKDERKAYDAHVASRHPQQEGPN